MSQFSMETHWHRLTFSVSCGTALARDAPPRASLPAVGSTQMSTTLGVPMS